MFAGIGGFRSALDELGGNCVFASEIDKYAVQSYEAIYGNKPAGDITKIEADEIPEHDVLTAGFPCPSFSVAGKGAGMDFVCTEGHTHVISFEQYLTKQMRCPICSSESNPKDERGLLFYEVARIANDKKPQLLLLENVKGLLSNPIVIETIAKTLNEIGYAVDFRVLNSKYFGVPQNRERIFIVADRDAQHEPWNLGKATDVVTKAKRRLTEQNVRTFNFAWPENNEVTVRLRDILEPTVDERYYLSEEKTAKLVAHLDNKTLADTSDCDMLGMVDLKGNESIRRVYSPTGVAPTGVAPTLTTMGGGHREPKIAEQVSGLAIREATVKDYAVTEEVRPVLTPDREEKRQNGRRFKDNEEESFTLTAQDKHGVAIGKYPRYRIRKLTPLECWRLQGFSDAAHETAKLAGVSDSQRYKQAGNAVTVNVISAIGKRLIARLSESVRSEAVVAVG